MKVIGITGGIGVGKTTATQILEKLGANIIDIDNLSKEVVKKGEEALQEIVEVFGEQCLKDNGELDREKVAEMVFGDLSKLDILSDIVHKRVYKKMREKLEEFRELDFNSIVIVDIPIPIKQFVVLFDEIWVIDSDMQNRIKRLKIRNGYTEKQIIARVDAQLPQKEYISMANQVIYNNGTEEEFSEKLDILYNLVKEKIFD